MIAGSRFPASSKTPEGCYRRVQRSQGDIIMMIDELHTVVVRRGTGRHGRVQHASNGPGTRRTAVHRRHHLDESTNISKKTLPSTPVCPDLRGRTDRGRHDQDAARLRDRYEAHHKVRYSDEALVPLRVWRTVM